MNGKILIVGSLNTDIVVKVKQMPVLGETILGEGLQYVMGGKGANQACAVGRLGGTGYMLGCVGEDKFGAIQMESLNRSGVDVSRMKTVERETGTAVILVDGKGNNSIVVSQGANKNCDVHYLKQNEDMFRLCDIILLQLEIPYEAIFYAVRKAKEYEKTVILNPAPAPEAGEISDEIYQMIDYITPNETELLRLSGTEDSSVEGLERGAEVLLEKGVKKVIVTMGDNGALLVSQEGKQIFAALTVEAVDTTAAGDCFNGAFAVAIAAGMNDELAIRYANAAASIAVSRVGAQNSIPVKAEVDQLLQTGRGN